MAARKLGAKLIVVDPVLSNIASKADLWLLVRPGTDVALALGMLNVLLTEGLYDVDYVARYCVGFNRLVERTREYALRRVSEITWLEEKSIVAAARLFALAGVTTSLVGAFFFRYIVVRAAFHEPLSFL